MLVRQRDALDEILHVAPLALNNLALTYNPQAGTLDTRANFGELSTSSRPTRPPSCAASSARSSARARSATGSRDLLAQRRAPGALDAAGALPAQDVFDPTLGGLVEVER